MIQGQEIRHLVEGKGVWVLGFGVFHLCDSDGMQPRLQHRPHTPEDHGRVDQVDLPHLPESNQIKSRIKMSKGRLAR